MKDEDILKLLQSPIEADFLVGLEFMKLVGAKEFFNRNCKQTAFFSESFREGIITLGTHNNRGLRIVIDSEVFFLVGYNLYKLKSAHNLRNFSTITI